MNEKKTLKAFELLAEIIEILNSGAGSTNNDRVESAMSKLGLDPEFVFAICGATYRAGQSIEKERMQEAEDAGQLDMGELAKIAKVARYYSSSLAFAAGYKLAKDEMAEAKP